MAIDPVQLALLTAKKATPASNKVGAGSVSTPPAVKPSLNLNQGGLQAVSTAMNTANTINNTPKPVITPEKIPQTGSFELGELSPDEVAFAKKAKQAGYSLEDTKTSIAKRRGVASPTTTQNIAGGLVQSATGIPSLGAKIANPIFGAVDKYIVDPLSRALGVDEAKIQANTARAEQARSNIIGGLDTAGQKLTGGDPESTAFKTAKLVGDIGQTIITPNAPGLTKGAGFIKGAGQLAGQGLAETVKYSAIADQRLPNKEELAYGVGGNVLIGGAIAGAPQVIKAIKGFKPIESIARKITGTADDYGKLFKSAEPRTNQLNKAVDYKNLQKNHNIASEEIVKAGYKPVDTASRAEAHANTMKKIRKEEIESKIGNNFRINLNPVADKIDEFVSKQKTAGLLKNEGQLAELKAQADKFRKMGEVDGADGEFIKEMLNSQINNRGDASLGDVYKNGLKEATKTLGQSLDDTFSAIPGQFAEAKRRFGALKATYQDVVKADIKAQKAKGLGIGETFGRIEGIGDIAGAIGGLVTGKNPLPQLASGFGKLAVGKVLAKIKDKDFLIQEGFEGLSKKIPAANTINISKKGTQLGLPLLKQTTKAPIAITPGGVIKQTPVTPKPTPKTPPITVEKGAIGMGTPKVNNTPVIPPKATVAPSVLAPKISGKIEYIPGKTDISNYSLGEYRNLVKQEFPGVHTENDIQRMYKTLQDEGTIINKPVAPKNGMPKLGKEIMEQNVTKGDDLISEAKKYKSADEFVNDNKIYHGTNQEFSDFDIELGGSATMGMPSAKGNIFFTKDKAEALSYAKASNKTQIVNQKAFDKRAEETQNKIDLLQSKGKRDEADNLTQSFEDEYYKKINTLQSGKQVGPEIAMERYIDPTKIKEITIGGQITAGELMSKLNNAKKEGYLGAKLLGIIDAPAEFFPNNKGTTQFAVWDKKALVDKKQLKQIREQANKKPLPPLPKKGLPKLGKEIMEQNVSKDNYQTNLFHGTENNFDSFDVNKMKGGTLGGGIYLTPNATTANKYANIRGSDTGKVLNVNLKKGLNILDTTTKEGKDIVNNLGIKQSGEFSNKIKGAGYDGFISNDKGGTYVIFNPDNVNISKKPLPPLPKKGK